jgi:hypothetical protein
MEHELNDAIEQLFRELGGLYWQRHVLPGKDIPVKNLVLYLIIGLGVKHGILSYYVEATRRPGPDSQSAR